MFRVVNFFLSLVASSTLYLVQSEHVSSMKVY